MSETPDVDGAGDVGLLGVLMAGLAADGSVRAEVAELPEGADSWRRTARAAGRQLGRPVQTLEANGMVHAALRDWPASPEEARRLQEQMRQAMQGVSVSNAATAPELTEPAQSQRMQRSASRLPPVAGSEKISGIEVVPLEQNVALEFESTPVAGTVVARRREASLVDDFADYLRSLGRTLGRHRIPTAQGGSHLATDLFDKTERILYEAKSSIDRSTIRLGLGQILDYRLLLHPEELGYRLLLPSRPPSELVELLAHYEIGVTWRDGDGWRDESPQPHSL